MLLTPHIANVFQFVFLQNQIMANNYQSAFAVALTDNVAVSPASNL
jgi:hypothetical protein